jgi:hypothetical protein
MRQGSWLALVAMAVNFSLAFGHAHAFDGSERAGQLVAAIATLNSDRSQDHPADNQADYLCPICMAATAVGAALAPLPPALLVEFAEAAIDRAIDHQVAVPHAPCAAFQSRGPPIS